MASISSTNGETDQVLVEEKFSVRIFTLNRLKQLNALFFEMLFRFYPLPWFLPIWLSVMWPGEIRVIYTFGLHGFGASCFLCLYQKLMKGQGRAFCAGGDVAAVVRDITLDMNFNKLLLETRNQILELNQLRLQF